MVNYQDSRKGRMALIGQGSGNMKHPPPLQQPLTSRINRHPTKLISVVLESVHLLGQEELIHTVGWMQEGIARAADAPAAAAAVHRRRQPAEGSVTQNWTATVN